MATDRGTVVVTGSSGGLGTAIVEKLASDPKLSSYHCICTVRDAAKATEPTPNDTREVVSLDLTKFDTVREVAKSINTRVSTGEIPPIRALILNAGYLDFGKQSSTSDGIDVTFAANYLGHWLLTLLLLGSMDKAAGRIVWIGSQSHDTEDPRNNATGAFTDAKYKQFLADGESSLDAIVKGTWGASPKEPGYRTSFRRYGAAKFSLAAMQHELQARLAADPQLGSTRICVVGVDPGSMGTGLQRLAPWFIRVVIWQVIYPFLLRVAPNHAPLSHPSKPASEVVEVALGLREGEDELPRDKYFLERKEKETSKESQDTAKRTLLWKESVKLTGLKEGETILANWQ